MTERDCGMISVCVCCLMAHAADGCGDCDHDREPLCLIEAPYTVTLGMMRELHSCEPDAEECFCEQLGFSWSSCEGCGSPLGGDRHALTLWGPVE